MNTVDDYEKAIKAKYAKVNHLDPDIYLINPTPAGLKSLCLALLDDLSVNDMRVYKHFFSLKDDMDARRQIEMFDTSRFKILCLFLKGNTKTTSADKLDLLAILINFEPRPFAKFRLSNNTMATTDVTETHSSTNTAMQTHPVIEKEEKQDEIATKNTFISKTASYPAHSNNTNKLDKRLPFYFISKDNYANWALTAIAALIVIYTFKDLLFKGDECMLWKKDHYEMVPCNTQTNSFVSNPVITADKETFAYQKKITACDTTTFFLPDGKPCVWYCKMRDGSIEYFSYPGLHPVTGVTLKKITPYMIQKYVMSQKRE